jgi:HEAT repeat protein
MDVEKHDESQRNDPRSTEELIRTALAEEDEDAAWELLVVLHHRASPQVFQAARELCASDNPRERTLGADILGRLGLPERTFPEESLAILLGMLDSEQDSDALAAAAMALGHFRDERATEALVRLKDHPSENVRYSVVHGLLTCENESAINALMELSADEDEDVRNWATFGIGSQVETHTEQIREALFRRLDESDSEIRGEALLGLARRGDGRVVKYLLKELSSDEVGTLAVEAARDIAHSRLYPSLLKLKEWWDVDQELLEEAISACQPITL